MAEDFLDQHDDVSQFNRRASDKRIWREHAIFDGALAVAVIGLIWTVSVSANDVENSSLENRQQIEAMREDIQEIRASVANIQQSEATTAATVNRLMGKLEIFMQQTNWNE